jgi:hypothetical protein
MRPCFIHKYFVGNTLPEAPELPRKQARFLSPVGVFAARATLYTAPVYTAPPERRGVFSNTGPSRFDPKHLGARLGNIDPTGPLWHGALGEVDPFSLLKIMSSSVLAIVSMMLPAEGASAHLCEDAIGGLRALSLAHQAIEQGELDDAVVLSFDDLSSPLSLAEIASQSVVPSSYSVAVVHLSCDQRAATHQLRAIEVLPHSPRPEERAALTPRRQRVGGAEGLALFLTMLPQAKTQITVEVSSSKANISVTLTSTASS